MRAIISGRLPSWDEATVQRVVNGVISVVALAMVAYHLFYAQYIVQQPLGHQNSHLGFAFLIIFLFGMKERKRRPWMLILLLLSLIATIYIQFNYQSLDLRAGGSHSMTEVAIGTIIIILVLIGTWIEFGLPLVIIAALFLLYAYFGYLLPEPWTTSPLSFERFISKMCINMEGIYGLILNVSAIFIFLFMVFASLMTATGAVGFFHEVGKFASRFFRAGAAVTAVVTSGLVGSVTGQSAANVAITGSFTIPAMKRAGYTAEQAAGIEAAASSGGPIIPPIMGVAAFLMAGILGISYFKIVIIAVIPALLYMFSCFCYVIFQGRAMAIQSEPEQVDVKQLLIRAPVFLVPFSVIILLFLKGFSPLYVGFWAVGSIIFVSFINKATRPSLDSLKAGFVYGAKLGSQIAVSCALLGLVIKVMTLTGLGIALPQIIRGFCGDNLLFLLILTGVVSIIMGTGLPAATSYIMVAIVIAPVLIHMGIPMLTAHFFCFYFCNFSYLTPPVALAAVFASKLAGANYIRTGLEASKVGIAAFIIPFLMIFSPAILLNFSEPIVLIILKYASSFIALVSLQAGIVGYFLVRLDIVKRIIFTLSAFNLLVGVYFSNILWLIAGITILIVLILWQYLEKRKSRSSM